MQHRSFRLTYSLMLIFSLFLLTISALIITIHYQKTEELLHQSIEKTMEQSAKNISQQTKEFNSHLLHLCIIGGRLLRDVPLEESGDIWLRFAFDEVTFSPAISDIYAANHQGSFAGATENPELFTRIIDRRSNPSLEVLKRRNLVFEVEKSETTTGKVVEFDPRSRPWFIQGIAAENYYVTEPYQFYGDHSIGITYTCPITNSSRQKTGVIGIDLTLHNLHEMLQDPLLKPTPNSAVYLFHENGQVIGYSENVTTPTGANPDRLLTTDSLKPWIRDSYQAHLKGSAFITSSVTDNVAYKSIYLPLDEYFAGHYHVGVVVPEDDFLAPLEKIRNYGVLLSIGIIALALLLLGFLVSRVSRPILDACKVAGSIRDFRLDVPMNQKSFYYEIAELQNALEQMRIGLRSFGKYLPVDLVRELIVLGKEAEVGGEKRYVVVMFTDIENFTHYSENSSPEKIAEQLNEYFDLLGCCITETGGLIDKYIGDAIMAIWNIPQDIADPEVKAARCALLIQDRLEKANQQWKEQGLPPFQTRIGLHAGEAIVGNLGASFRINYTAIGDVINVTSRLEGINKELGSTVLASQTIYDKIKYEFTCKEHGMVSLKGKSDTVSVYEILQKIGEL